MASDRVVLHGNILFSILIFSTKKQYSSFFEKVFVFSQKLFRSYILKTFKISSACHRKPCRSFKRRSILKIPSTLFQKSQCSFCWLQNNTSKKKRSCVKTKSNSNFVCRKTCWKEQPFIFYLFDESLFSNICTL